MGFTLTELMLVVAIISLLAVISVPNFLRSRKRAQAVRVLNEIRALDSAIDQYTLEHNRAGTEAITPGDSAYFRRYVKTGTRLYDSLPYDFLGNAFVMTTLDLPPKVSTATFDALSDVAPMDFWSPFNP